MKLAALFLTNLVAFMHHSSAQHINLPFQHLNQADGLSQSICSFTSRDREGFVWIGTIDGLNRFNGQRIKTYRPNPNDLHSLKGNNVTSRCFEDEHGDLWFTTYNGIHRYNRSTDNFDVFQIKNARGQFITEDYYAFHFDQKGRFWCRIGLDSSGFLHLFDTRQLLDSLVCPMDGLRACVITDAKGTVQQVVSTMFSRKKGLVVTDMTRNFEKKTYLAGIDGGPAFETNEAFVESDTVLWVGLWSGMGRLNLQTGQLKTFTTFGGKALGSIWGICPYGSQNLFTSSTNSGLLLFDKQKGEFVQQFLYELGAESGLQSNDTHDLYLDGEENLWVSQWGNGLTHVNLRKNKFCLLPNAKGQFVSYINTLPDGNIMCNTRAGIFIYTPQKELLEILNNRIPGQTDFALLSPAFPDRNLYFFKNQVFVLDRKGKKIHKVQEIKDLNLRQVIHLPSGKNLAVCQNGLYELESDSGNKLRFSPFPMAKPYPFKGAASAFCDQNGHILVSENADLLLIFENTPNGLSLLKTIPGMGVCKAFLEMPENGAVWIASTVGLARLEADLSLHLYNELEDGLPNETFYAVLPDRKGQLWLPSNRGLWCYNTTSHTKRGYKTLDGLMIREFNTDAWHIAPNGEIWVGGIGGLVAFHPDSIQPDPYTAKVQFAQILINDSAQELGSPVEAINALDLRYQQNTVSFEFVALEFSNPSSIQFKYRLVGYDEAWVNSGTRGFARYANLPPGDYTFEILAANSDGIWSTVPKILAIHIQTPFYKTWWFYLLCALSFGGLIYGWLWYRLQQALKIERMRVQISSDLHDDVGTLLAGLAMQSEALELTAQEKDKNKLQRISEISRNAMAHMRDTVWAIDARKDKLENLLDRMREHAEETLTPRDIRFDIQVDHLSLKQNLPTNIRQNLYLIYKEAITNAAKHTNGDMVTISLKKTGEGFEMRICDNGQVEEKGYKTTGLGTSNMQMRAEKIGGRLEISRKDGFCVVLRMGGLN